MTDLTLRIPENLTDTEWEKTKDFVYSALRSKIVTVTFIKTDGSERVMKCTLHGDLLPARELKESTTTRAKPDNIISVYDLDKEDWRSFNLQSLKKIAFPYGEAI